MSFPRCLALPLLATLLPNLAMAGGHRAAGLTEARQLAAGREEPILALVWGEWLPASALLRERIWESSGLTQGLSGAPVLCPIEVAEAPSEEKQAQLDAANGEKWNEGVGVRLTVPAVYFYSSSGRWLAALEGEELRALQTAEEFVAALNGRLEVVRRSDELERRLAEARAAGDREEELAILVQIADLPLQRPDDLAAQLRAIDPQDRSGWVARLEFPGWPLVRTSGERAKNGEALQVVQELQQMLSRSGYTDEQKAMIHAAWGNALRHSDQMQEAIRQFEQAFALDPEGVVGQSAAAVAKLIRN